MDQKRRSYQAVKRESLAPHLFHRFCTNLDAKSGEFGSRCAATTPGYFGYFQNSGQTVVSLIRLKSGSPLSQQQGVPQTPDAPIAIRTMNKSQMLFDKHPI
jgi:hypothetical protein